VILELAAVIVLAIVVFAFVLEPVLRARSDRVVLDAVALPRPADSVVNDDELISVEISEADEPLPERSSSGRVTLDRPGRSVSSETT